MKGKEERAASSLGRAWYRRKAAAFSLVMAAATIALVHFAWREADRERLVWEQDQRLKLEQAVDLVADKTLSTLSDLLLRLSRMYRPAARTQEGADSVDRAIIAELFAIERDGAVTFPLFRPPFRLASAGLIVAAFDGKTDKLRSAELLEFGRKDFPAAVQAYRAVLSSAATRSQRGWAINAMARALAKAGRSSEALTAYRDLTRELGAEKSEDGIPLGIVGAFASAQVSESIGRFEDAAACLLDLRDRLVRGDYDLEKNQFIYFLGDAEDRFSAIAGRIETGEARRALVSRHEGLLKAGGEILARAERAGLIALDPGRYRGDRVSFSILPARPTLYMVGSAPLPEGMIYGVLFDPGQIATRLVPEIARTLGLGGVFRVDLIARESDAHSNGAVNNAVPDNRAASYERALAPDLSPWTIRIRTGSLGRIGPRFGLRKAAYVSAAMIFVAAVFIGGLVTIRAMAREMELVRLKTDFVATVSHELRTPLTSIRYISELLKEGRVDEEARKSQYYKTLHNESERLSRIIENILDFSKIEAGLKEYRFERTETGAFTADIAVRFQEMITPKGFLLKAEIPGSLPAVSMDAEAFGRALFNILDNAVKYAGESRELELSSSFDAKEIRWKIVDHGLGISPEDKTRVFERFFRSKHGADPNIKGSGIGLTIAKHIVEVHGGTISVESELGRGSTITVAIPIGRVSESETLSLGKSI